MPRARQIWSVLMCSVFLLSGGAPLAIAQETTGTPEALTAASAAGDAPKFRGNPAGTGEVPGSGPDGKPVILWSREIGMTPWFSQPTPATGEGLVVASTATSLIALDAETGAEKWRIPHVPSDSSPLIQEGMVFIGTFGEGLKALDAATGEQIWQFLAGDVAVPDSAPPESFDSAPVIVDGTLYTGSGPYGGLYALDPATGEERWRFDTLGAAGTSPAIRDGVVFISSDALWDVNQDDPAPSSLYAVDAATGEERWHVAFGAEDLSFSSPVATDEAVVVGVTNPMVGSSYYLAVDAATGDELWRVDLDGPLWMGTPGANGDLVYLAGGETPALIAVDAATGEERWRFEVGLALFTAPVIADGLVYLQSQDGYLTALDAVTGAEQWRMLVGSGGSPVVADGKIYTGAWGNLVALGNADGATAASVASQPLPPASGPGSEDTPFPAARVTKYGPAPGGYWIWEPAQWAAPDAPVAEGPFPAILYLSGCCGNGIYPTPEEVDPWLSHLARQGYVVIAPVYNSENLIEDSNTLLRQALEELGRAGHPAVDLSRFGVIGFSFGGTPAIQYAAAAEAEGLPIPSAVFLTAPCTDCVEIPEEPLSFPEGMKSLVIAYEDDFLGLDLPRQAFDLMASVPEENRDFVLMSTDGHGVPAIYAGHPTTYGDIDAADRYALWKLSDALFACAFTDEDCEYALGNTPEQRFMGLWSDGVPVTELVITDDPMAAAAPVATPVP